MTAKPHRWYYGLATTECNMQCTALLRGKNDDHFGVVLQRIEGLRNLHEAVSVKVGGEYRQTVEYVDATRAIGQANVMATEASELIQKFLNYSDDVAFFTRRASLPPQTEGNKRAEYMQRLKTFCQTHRLAIDSMAFVVQPTGFTERIFDRLTIFKITARFVDKHGV